LATKGYFIIVIAPGAQQLCTFGGGILSACGGAQIVAQTVSSGSIAHIAPWIRHCVLHFTFNFIARFCFKRVILFAVLKPFIFSNYLAQQNSALQLQEHILLPRHFNADPSTIKFI